ncbi:hypothetical protein C2E23DRAFT_510110 [Lenzites betulinus]|nr:hypothetical protein C2E23DRAFT_510110 [Lenzites betulinus]
MASRHNGLHPCLPQHVASGHQQLPPAKPSGVTPTFICSRQAWIRKRPPQLNEQFA